MRRFLLALFVTLPLLATVSCSWWQKHGSEVSCAAITTVQNAPQLMEIVIQCTSISVSPANIIPCIESAAGSKWASDVIQCFAGTVGGVTSCPAVPLGAAPSLELRQRMKAAIEEKGYSYKQ